MTRREEIIKEASKEHFAHGWEGSLIDAFTQGALWADANPVNYDGKAMLHVLEKGVKQGKRETLNKVCEWLLNNVRYYSTNALRAEYMCEDLRKAMEE